MESMENKRQRLFGDFPAVSTAAWEEKIRVDLKGADYEKKLLWKTQEGLSLRPYYRKEDLEKLKHLDHPAGQFPFIRGKATYSNLWRVRQDLLVNDVVEANAKALDILMKGVDSLGFILTSEQTFDRAFIDALLRNIYAHSVELNFSCKDHALDIIRIILELVKAYNRDLDKIQGSVDYDPLMDLALQGRYKTSEAESFGYASSLIEEAAHLPHFRVIGVHANHFHNAGANTVQELALALAVGNEYLARITDLGMSVTRVAPRIGFQFATGSNFFMEIAKYRAARLLWAHIVKEYGGDPTSSQMYIYATTSRWNKTIYDPYVNMLRTTTESMSAILAGIDSLSVGAYDEALGKRGEFGERIARNQQLLLKEESYLDKVADPAAGSYFIESLTEEIAAAAWKLFQDIEVGGGFLQALYRGDIQEMVTESARQRDMDIAMRKITLLGVNQYPNPQEVLTQTLDQGFWQEDPPEQAAGDIPTLRLYRGGASFERLRHGVDQYVQDGGQRPEVFLLTFGNLAFRKARAGFASNFFSCAGFKIIDNPGFTDIEKGIQAARDSGAHFVVICSSDEEYAEAAPRVQSELGATTTVILAGYPKEILNLLQASGIKEYIHLRSNVLESLRRYVNLAGIEV